MLRETFSCFNFDLTPVVEQPTRGDNILDHTLTSTPEIIKTVNCVAGLNDHGILIIELSIPVPTLSPTVQTIREL